MKAEGAGVDSSKDDLFGAGGSSRRGFIGDTAGGAKCFLDGGWPWASAGVRDGAVGAEVVASVLDFEEGAGAVARGVL